MDLSIIIVSYNTKKLTENCLKSIKKHTRGISYEIIVIDNNSDDSSVELLRSLSRQDQKIRLIESKKNLGFAGGNNKGIERAKGEYILLLNSDTLISSNVLGEMVNWMREKPKVGIATCSLKNQDSSIQGTGGYFPTLVRVFSWMTIQDFPLVDKLIKPFHPIKNKSFSKGISFYKNKRQLDWVTGAFVLMRGKIVKEVGLMDEAYFMYVEEVDYCYRVKKKGWEVWYLPAWNIVHYGGASSSIAEFSVLSEFKGIKRFYKKHYPKWQYLILRILLKIGALGRILVMGILEGPESAKIYAKAFVQA